MGLIWVCWIGICVCWGLGVMVSCVVSWFLVDVLIWFFGFMMMCWVGWCVVCFCMGWYCWCMIWFVSIGWLLCWEIYWFWWCVWFCCVRMIWCWVCCFRLLNLLLGKWCVGVLNLKCLVVVWLLRVVLMFWFGYLLICIVLIWRLLDWVILVNLMVIWNGRCVGGGYNGSWCGCLMIIVMLIFCDCI